MQVKISNKIEKTTRIEISQADLLDAMKYIVNSRYGAIAGKSVEFTWEDLEWHIHGWDEEYLMDPCATIIIVETSYDEA